MKVGDLSWRWLCAALAVVVLVLAAIVFRHGSAGHGSVEPVEQVPAVMGLRPTEVIQPAPLAGSAPSVAESAAGLRGVDEIQICGGAWVKTQSDGSLDDADIERATRLPQARLRVVAGLKSDKSELAQAAALMLEMATAGATNDQVRDALAQKAASGTDPRAYALAYNTCGADKRGEGACQLLSAAQWARLDPGNASPWLAALAEARVGKDRVAEDEALHRIATSQRSDLGFFVLPGLILDAAPADDASALAAWVMVTEAIGSAAAHSLPGYQHVTTACRATALRDPNRQQTCLAIAELLSERSDTVIERMIGVAMGRQLGWPAERSDRMRGEYDAYVASLTAKKTSSLDGLACAEIRRDLDGVRQMAALGETGVLREWIAHSGKKPEDFGREHRLRQKLAAERAGAESAAATASMASAARPSSASAPP